MTLADAKKNEDYLIKGLFVEEAVTRRLQALGLNDGVKISVLNRKRCPDYQGERNKTGARKTSFFQYRGRGGLRS